MGGCFLSPAPSSPPMVHAHSLAIKNNNKKNTFQSLGLELVVITAPGTVFVARHFQAQNFLISNSGSALRFREAKPTQLTEVQSQAQQLKK